MDKLQQIRLPIVKEFEEFKSLFDASLQSSNPLLSEVLTYIKQWQDDASYSDVADGQIIR